MSAAPAAWISGESTVEPGSAVIPHSGLPNVPKWTANAYAEYRASVGATELFARYDLQYSSSQITSLQTEGALVPVLPVAFGARNLLAPLAGAGVVIVAVSVILAFLSGMEIRRRVVLNLVIIAATVGITYLIGTITKAVWGIAV